MICIIDCGTSYIDIFQKHLSEFDFTSEVVDVGKIGEHDFEPYSGIIITGAPTLLTHT